MRTRPEQVQAYRFITRRIVGALLTGEPETNDMPMRRLANALIGSVMVAAIVLAGIGVYGLVSPGGGKPENGDLVAERETSSLYLYRDGTLLPMLNIASARLAVGADAPVRYVSQASLRDLPRGATYGIPGAPNSLPDRKDLRGLPWSVCSMARGQAVSGRMTVLHIGAEPGGGAALEKSAVVVKQADGGPAGKRYLLWNDTKWEVDDLSLSALNLTAATPVPVGLAFLNAVTSKGKIAPPDVGDRTKNSSVKIKTKDAKIGTVYRAIGGDQRYVLLVNGLSPIGQVMAEMLQTGKPEELTASEVSQANLVASIDSAGFPQQQPTLHQTNGDSALCAAYQGGDPNLSRALHVFDRAPALPSRVETSAVGSTGGPGTADWVLLQGGSGALVREQLRPDVAAEPTVYLITAQGVKYPLKEEAATLLGYGNIAPVSVPADLLALVPTGPTLDKAAAGQPITGAPGTTAGPPK